MGVGETVELDERGRITIPAHIRRRVGAKSFLVELVDGDTILLKALRDRRKLVERVKSIKLSGDAERAFVDAASVKHVFGGVKD